MATATVTTPVTPIKFNLEIVAGGIMAGVILGLINRFVGTNLLLKFIIGALLFFFGPTTSYGSFIKLAGIAMMGDVAYDILKNNVVINTS